MAQKLSTSGSHDLQVTCEQCHKQFSRPQDKTRHVIEVHNIRKTCPFGCGYGTSRAQRLQKHLIEVHDASKIAISLVSSKLQTKGEDELSHTHMVQINDESTIYYSTLNNSYTQASIETKTYATRSKMPVTGIQVENAIVQENGMVQTYTELLEKVGYDWIGFGIL